MKEHKRILSNERMHPSKKKQDMTEITNSAVSLTMQQSYVAIKQL